LSDEPEKKSEMLAGSQRALEDDGAGAPEGEGAGAAEDEGDGGPEDEAAEAPEDGAEAAAAGGAALAVGVVAAGPPNRLVPPLQLDATSAMPSRAAIGTRSRQRILVSPRPAHG